MFAEFNVLSVYVKMSGPVFVKSAISPALGRLLIFFTLFQAVACAASLDFPVLDLRLKGKLYHVEIADTAERKSQGLMFRRSLGRNAGMLFPYDAPVDLKIWMKNTLIPLAVIWLDEQARVIHKMILHPCRTPSCPSFGPQQYSSYVIELHPAEIDRFKIGDRLVQVLQWRSAK